MVGFQVAEWVGKVWYRRLEVKLVEGVCGLCVRGYEVVAMV